MSQNRSETTQHPDVTAALGRTSNLFAGLVTGAAAVAGYHFGGSVVAGATGLATGRAVTWLALRWAGVAHHRKRYLLGLACGAVITLGGFSKGTAQNEAAPAVRTDARSP